MYPGLFSCIWDAMQLMTRALPHEELSPQKRAEVIAYLKTNAPLVPCPGCAYHAQMYLVAHPLDSIQTGDDAFHWVVDFHNDVNRRTGKREYTYKEAEDAMIARYEGEFKGLPKAQLIQKEDHKKIKELEDEIKLFKNIPHASTNEAISTYTLIAMIVSFVILLLVLFILVGFCRMSRKISRFERALVTTTM